MRTIARDQIARFQHSLARSQRTLAVTPEALEQLVHEGYSLVYGARFLKRIYEDRIKLPISQRWTEGKHFAASVKEGVVGIEITAEGGAHLAATA